MSYLVLARKWRPQTFTDLVGQEHVARTLQNAISSGRVAHAFLFSGARGVGKTSAARILAKALNCIHGPATEPCNTCSICNAITEGHSVDVLEIDGASNNGVDQVRELREDITYLPAEARSKIIIIDEVHMLSTSAFNALLKTLEEPPPHVTFIFATTEPHKVPVTILSRCQRFEFRRIPFPLLMERLRFIARQEGVSISDEALAAIARKGDGSLRDSLSAFDQVLAYCGTGVPDDAVSRILGIVDRRLVAELIDAVASRDPAATLAVIATVDSSGYNTREFARETLHHLRKVFLQKASGNSLDPGDISDTERDVIDRHASSLSMQDLERMLSILLKTEAEMAHSSFPRYHLELAAVRMATLVPVVEVDRILSMLRDHHVPPPPRRQRQESHPLPTPTPTPRHAPPPLTPPPESLDAAALWETLVDRIRMKKPFVATNLAKARPIRIDREQIVCAFPPRSSELELLKDGDRLALIKSVANELFGSDPKVSIVELDGEEPVLPSIEEKKNLEKQARESELREKGESLPLVKEIINRFSAEVTDIRPGTSSRNRGKE